MLIAKEKVKGMFDKKSPQEAAGHNSDPPNKHTIVDQGCSWTTPSKNSLGDVFFYLGFNKASYILGKFGVSENFK